MIKYYCDNMKRISKKRIDNLLNKIIIIIVLIIIGAIIEKNYKEDTSVFNEANGNVEIYFFDVGQADSILISKNDNTVLIDAGNNSDGEKLVQYLKEELNINDIDILVLTHPHEDHIGGMDNIIDNFDIGAIYMPDVTTNTETFTDVLKSIKDHEYRITTPKIGDKFNLEQLLFEVIYTGTDETDLNNSSIVLRLDYGNTSYLFTGDATNEVENNILNSNIDVDVLKVGHHGSKYSTTDEFLKAVSPKYAIISVGENSYDHPSDIILKRLKNNNILVYRTDEKGTIKLTSDGKNIDFTFLDTEIDGDI